MCMIVVGSLVAATMTLLIPVISPAILAFCLVGFAIGPPPGPLMALLPRALPPERLTRRPSPSSTRSST